MPEAVSGLDEIGWPRPLALLRALLSEVPGAATDATAGMAPDDWNSFADLVISRHRVAPYVAKAVAECNLVLPDHTLTAITAEARANGFAALAQRNESLTLARRLRAAGIEPVFLKGWPLAEQLYGAVGLRQSSDIDIVVRVGARSTAARCLAEAGYVAAEDHRLRDRLIDSNAVRGECKDVQYRHPETGLVVELHWRTSQFRYWPELSDLGESPVALPGLQDADRILVPGPLSQLVYLAEHGQQHLFGRLKWLLDIAVLARCRGSIRLADDLLAAEKAGAGPAVRIALHLAGKVFGAPVPDVARELSPREAEWVRDILAGIADPSLSPGSPRARIGFYRWHLRMARTPAQVLGVLRYAFWRPLRLGMAWAMRPGSAR